MKKIFALSLSLVLVAQPVLAAMTGGGGSSSSSSSSASSSSSPSSSGSSDASGSYSSSTASHSSNSYATSGSGNYGSRKDKKKKAFDPFERIYGLIRLEKFAEAHEAIKFISVPTPSKQADKFNLLGFTARKSGNLQAAGEYYERALEINPKHIQALEYQGELFLQLGEIEQAKKNLEKINEICWLVCKEKNMLKRETKRYMKICQCCFFLLFFFPWAILFVVPFFHRPAAHGWN